MILPKLGPNKNVKASCSEDKKVVGSELGGL